jgi:hypothetical protein
MVGSRPKPPGVGLGHGQAEVAGCLCDLVAHADCDRKQVVQPSRSIGGLPAGHRGDFCHDPKHQGHRV